MTRGGGVQASFEAFEELKQVVGFGEDDVANLLALEPLFHEHGQEFTEDFYDLLLSHAETSDVVDGRIDRLIRTFRAWLSSLFCGRYGRRYYTSRFAIGAAHARVGVPQRHVEAGLSLVRTRALVLMGQKIQDPAVLVARYRSLLRVLDLDAMLINLAYDRERVDHNSGQTREVLTRLVQKR